MLLTFDPNQQNQEIGLEQHTTEQVMNRTASDRTVDDDDDDFGAEKRVELKKKLLVIIPSRNIMQLFRINQG